MRHGTAGIEAVKRGMRFVGIDLDPGCCDVTAGRYADWKAVPKAGTAANAGAWKKSRPILFKTAGNFVREV